MVKASTFSSFKSAINSRGVVLRELVRKTVGACSLRASISLSQFLPNSFSRVSANQSGIEYSMAFVGTVPFLSFVKMSATLIPSNSSNFL